jgi:parvulin-like peptidyl-prolyl isomerase
MARFSPPRALFACACLVSWAAGCPRPSREADNLKPLATVNGEAISRADFERDWKREPQSDHPEVAKRALLSSLIDRMLLLQAAAARDVRVSGEEVEREVLRMSADYPEGGFAAALDAEQLTLAELKEKARARLTIERLFAFHVYPAAGVTEEELQQHYQTHLPDYQRPEEVWAAQIVVHDVDEAKKILAQLKAGKRFADMARRYSLSPDAKVGGDLGFFARGVMPPAFDEVVFRLSPNQISDVVATDYGFHLFKVLQRRPGGTRPFAEVRAQVEARALEEKRTQAQADFLKALHQESHIEVNEPALLVVARPSLAGEKK